jgi:endoglucanase
MNGRWAPMVLAAIVCLMPGGSGLESQQASPSPTDRRNVPDPKHFAADSVADRLSLISVEGNRFVDQDGNTIVFRGVNISDPDKLADDGRWNRRLFEVIADWGANIVRVPVHPVAWRERGPAGYLGLLDQAVVWASELGLYLIIDWHSIGNLSTGLFERAMYETSLQETLGFWTIVAHRYSGVPTIAFYELFNEPTTHQGRLGTITWQRWKDINEEIIEIIFAHDDRVVPLVAGFDWAYELRHVVDDPIGFAGVGYVTHPYPMKVPEPWRESWERDFGHVADRYPVFATEFGFMVASDPGAHIPVIGDEHYGRAIIDFLEERGISWTVWCFDPDWPPQLIADWRYTPTRQGAFFRGALQQHR